MASRPRDRKEILRGVYEDNLRSTRDSYARFSRSRGTDKEKRPRGIFVSGTLSAVAGLFLLLAAALAASDQDVPVVADATPATSISRPPLPEESYAPAPLPAETEENPSVADLYGLHRETIVIDAGHGGRDPGASGRQGLQEKEITLDVALRLKKRLEKYAGYRILLTRDVDEDMLLRERIKYSNVNDADLFVSLHVNWLPVDSIAPIETYYYGPDSDPRAMRLAQRENRNSGYSVAEFTGLTQRLHLDLKIQESRDAAHSIQEGLINGLRSMGRDVNDWGAKSGDFMVLLGVDSPSILAEIGSLSNTEEESQLNTVSYREKLAYLLERGIANYLEQPAHESEPLKHGSEEENEGI